MMDLSVAMRYVMVQALKEAGGANTFVEHIYMALLSLRYKKAIDIAPSADHIKPIETDIKDICQFCSQEKIDVWPTLHLLREALDGNLPSDDIPAPEADVASLIVRARKLSQKDNREKITVSDVIKSCGQEPTPLIALCLIHYDTEPTAKEKAAGRAKEVIGKKLGLSPVSDEETKTVYQSDDRTVLAYDEQTAFKTQETEEIEEPEKSPPKQEPKKKEPKKEESKKAEPKKAEPAKKEEPKKAEPAKKEEPKKAEPPKKEEPKKAEPPKKEEPKKAEPAKKEEPKKAEPPKKKEQPKKYSPKTTISWFTLSGEWTWAAIKFMLYITALGVGVIYFFKTDYGQNLLQPNLIELLQKVVVIIWALMMTKIVTSFFGRPLVAIEIFFNMVFNIAFGYIILLLYLDYAGLKTTPDLVKKIFYGYGVLMYVICYYSLQAKRRLWIYESSAMFEFFILLTLLLQIPGMAAGIIWLENIEINKFWWDMIVICLISLGFWIIYILLRAWKRVYKGKKSYPNYRTYRYSNAPTGLKINFWVIFLFKYSFLPYYSACLIRYFDMLPLKTWVLVLYGVYFGFCILIGIMLAEMCRKDQVVI
jgi:hypothetical protein